MSTLNARARRAWANVADNPTDVNYVFEHQRAAFESGYRARDWGLPTREQIAKAVGGHDSRQRYDGPVMTWYCTCGAWSSTSPSNAVTIQADHIATLVLALLNGET